MAKTKEGVGEGLKGEKYLEMGRGGLKSGKNERGGWERG